MHKKVNSNIIALAVKNENNNNNTGLILGFVRGALLSLNSVHTKAPNSAQDRPR